MDTTMLVKTNKTLKTEAQHIAKSTGIPLSTIINAQLRQFVRDRKIELEATPLLNPSAKKRIASMLKDIDNRKNVTTYASSKDFLASLGK